MRQLADAPVDPGRGRALGGEHQGQQPVLGVGPELADAEGARLLWLALLFWAVVAAVEQASSAGHGGGHVI